MGREQLNRGDVSALGGVLVPIERRYRTAEEVDLVRLADDLYHGRTLYDHGRLMRALGTLVDLESLPVDELKALMELAVAERLSPTRRRQLLGRLSTLVAERDPRWLFDSILVPAPESGRGRLLQLGGYDFESAIEIAAKRWADEDAGGALRWLGRALGENRFGTSGRSSGIETLAAPLLAAGWVEDRPQMEEVVQLMPDREREAALVGMVKTLPGAELLAVANWAQLSDGRVREQRRFLLSWLGERFEEGEWAKVEEFAGGLSGEGVRPHEFVGAAASRFWRPKKGRVAAQLDAMAEVVDGEHAAYMIGSALGAQGQHFPKDVLWGHAKRLAKRGHGELVLAAFLMRAVGRSDSDAVLERAAAELGDTALKADVAVATLYDGLDSGRRQAIHFERKLGRAGFNEDEIEIVRRRLER